MFVPWNFHDPVTAETYVFEHNPSAMTSPRPRRALTAGRGTDAGVRVVSGRVPIDWEFSGKLRSQTQYDAFVNWSLREYPIVVVDHFLTRRVCIPTGFEPQDVRSMRSPWLHSYTFACRVIPTTELPGSEAIWVTY